MGRGGLEQSFKKKQETTSTEGRGGRGEEGGRGEGGGGFVLVSSRYCKGTQGACSLTQQPHGLTRLVGAVGSFDHLLFSSSCTSSRSGGKEGGRQGGERIQGEKVNGRFNFTQCRVEDRDNWREGQRERDRWTCSACVCRSR